MNGRINHQEPNVRLMLPRIGRIKIGKKELSRNGKEYPVSVDYFIPAGKYAGLFTKAYGEKPQTIQVVFPDDDPAKVCCEYYEYRDDKGQLIAKGDGSTFFVWTGDRYLELDAENHPGLMDAVTKRYPSRGGWRVRLTLNFVVPLVRGVAGVWTFETNGSASTIPQVRDAFDAVLATRGFVKGVIFDLNVKFATSQKPGDRSRYPVVTLIPNESEDNVRLIKAAYKPVNLLTNGQSHEHDNEA